MKYIVKYQNPTRMNPDCESTFSTLGELRAFLRRMLPYSGSFELGSIEKQSAKGSEFISLSQVMPR